MAREMNHPIIASGTIAAGVLKISAVDGTAFVDPDSDAAASAHFLAAVKHNDKIVIRSKTNGQVIWGYAKAAGSGETLDTDINASYDFTAPWELNGGAAIVDANSFSSTGSGGLIAPTAQMTVRKLYKTTLSASTTGGTVTVRDMYSVVTLAANDNTATYKTLKSTSGTKFFIHVSATATVDVTTMTCQQVLTPAATGVTISSLPGGTTMNWGVKDASFGYNDSAGYDYQIISSIPNGRTVSSYIKYSSDFSATADSISQNIGDANLQVTGNNDGVDGEDDCLKVYANGGKKKFGLIRFTSLTDAARYQVTFKYWAESGSGLAYLDLSYEWARTTISIPVVEGSWQTVSVMYTSPSSAMYIGAFTSATASTAFDYLESGKSVYFKDFVFTELNTSIPITSSQLKLSTVDGTAFFFHDSIDFSSYEEGDHKYLLAFYDSTGKAALAYGKSAGAGETLSAEINSGTLDSGKLYQITATELDHFGTGLEVDDYFTSDGTETCDASNKVKQVTAGPATGLVLQNAAGDENFVSITSDFDPNAVTGIKIWRAS